MKFLYVDSVQIVLNNILWGMLEVGLDVERASVKVDIFNSSEDVILKIIDELKDYDMAVSQNFIPDLAEACHRVNKKYISWVYDSPQVALFNKVVYYETNYIFMFDEAGANMLNKKGIKVYYLPLAANIYQAGLVDITDEDIVNYGSDVSFVGSLYTKNYLDGFVDAIPLEFKNEIDGYISDRLCIFQERKEYIQGFSDELINYIYEGMNKNGLDSSVIDKNLLVETLIGTPLLAHKERVTILNELAARYNTRLYTNEKNTYEIKANVFPGVDYEKDVYKVYFSSKINLNITWRGIVSGVPQRIFDIMAVGGFALSSYQSEIPKLFEIGKEIEVFHDIKELHEKIEYYLSHERERLQICLNGHNKVRELYNYRNAILKILETVVANS